MAERAFDFVRNTVNEMKALEVIVAVVTFCLGLFGGWLGRVFTDFVQNTVNEMKALALNVPDVTFCFGLFRGS